MRVLHTLWRKRCPVRDAEESRVARLEYLSKIFSRPVRSANDLSDRELKTAVDTVMSDLSASHKKASKVTPMPNRNVITKEQVWKVRQLVAWLKWTEPIRLEHWLRSKFGCRRPEELTFSQGWRCIEALFYMAARAAAPPGATKKEFEAERQRIKREIRTWRPPAIQPAATPPVDPEPPEAA